MQNDLKEQTEKAFNFDAFGKFRSADEIAEKAKATGTGLLTGTAAIPSDIVTMAETANTFLADYANNPLSMLIKDNLQSFEKQYGRKAFDEGFEEITGIKSDPENTDQLIGEILSPTGAFLAPTKVFDKLSDGASTLYNTVKNTLSKSDFVKSDLVAEGADLPLNVIKQADDINRPKIDLNTVAPDSVSAKGYYEGEARALESARQKLDDKSANYKDLTFEDRLKLYDETGIYRGEDGKIRSNISMKETTLKNDAFEVSEDFDKIKLKPFNYRLQDILNHQDLFNRYDKSITTDKTNAGVYRSYLPSSYKKIGDVRIRVIPDEQSPLSEIDKGGAFASYDPIDDIIYVPQKATKDDMLSAITHEIQHAIQYREGFQGGDNLLRHLPKNYLDEYKKAQEAIKVDQDKTLVPQKRELQDWLKPSVDTIFEDAMVAFYKAEYNRTFSDPKEQVRYIQNYIDDYKDEFEDVMKDTFRQLAKREARSASKYGKINLNVKQGDKTEFGFEFSPGQIALIKHFTEGGGKSKGNIMYTEDLAKQERIEYGADRAPTPQSLNSTIHTRRRNFEDHIKYLAKTERRLLQLDNIYNMARNKYMNSFGEKEARYAEMRLNSPDLRPADDMFFKLRKGEKSKKPINIVTSEDN
tara:strand:- start:203 stop:2122 length:1920 start_codon:yes stop_codon:yes gene_type:complete